MSLRGFRNILLAIWLSLGIISGAYGAEMCQYVFEGPKVQPRAVDFGLNRTAQDSSRLTPIELVKYKETKAQLRDALNTVPETRRKEIEHLLSAVEFFDYTHTANQLLTNFLDGKRETFNFSRLYDRSEAEAVPFNGFLSARDYLKTEKPAVTPELLGEIHKRIMAEGVEGIKAEQLGVWRNGHWIGNSAGAFKMNSKEVEIVAANPYLAFVEISRAPGILNESIWKNITVWANKRNTTLAPVDTVLVQGKIHYPFVRTPKQETVDLIKDSHPDIYKEIMEFRQTNELAYSGIAATPAEIVLETKFTKALVEQRFAKFNADSAALGEIKIGINEHQYIDLVADFQRDLVAIHPVLNGNGRTTRLFMNYLLTRQGLPPVRLVDPYLDVQVSKEEWREYVHKGVVNNAKLYDDVVFRVKNGLTVEYSPELLYPGLPETVSIALKKQGSNDVKNNYALAKVDGEQFNAFLKTIFEAHPELRQEIANDRLRAMSRIVDLFVEYYRAKTIRYIHEKDGEREIALRLVDQDFVDLFGQNRSYSKELWDNKIDRWYDKNMLAWRGLSNRSKEYTVQELLEYFKTPTSHLVSNRVLNALRTGKPLVEAIKDDFKTYNKESLNGDMVEMAVDHHRTGPKYRDSYGYSTSKREVVGKAFAMGAMVVGEYGKHMDPALQAQLKSRINVAAFRANKDVDLGRLKAFDPEFSYIYGRQAEVMGIGGTDPDAVVLLQRLDAKGEVIETLLRDFAKPSEIMLIQGRYVPGEGPLPTERIKARYDLNTKVDVQNIAATPQQKPAEPVVQPTPQVEKPQQEQQQQQQPPPQPKVDHKLEQAPVQPEKKPNMFQRMVQRLWK